jgi:hypothetical protein
MLGDALRCGQQDDRERHGAPKDHRCCDLPETGDPINLATDTFTPITTWRESCHRQLG